MSLFSKTEEQGAQTQIHCATAPDVVPGADDADCAVDRTSTEARDDAAAMRLWEQTEQVVAEASAK